MTANNYIYKNPIDNGYKQFKLTKKQHNKLFKHRQIKWYDKYEYYYNEHSIMLHRFINTKTVILYTILFPILIFLVGLVNIRDSIHEMKKMYNKKKYGSFSSEFIYSKTDVYNQIMSIIKN